MPRRLHEEYEGRRPAYWVYRLNGTTSFRSGWGPILKHRPGPPPAIRERSVLRGRRSRKLLLERASISLCLACCMATEKHPQMVLSLVPTLLSNVPMMHPLAFLPASSSGDLCQEKPGVFNPVTETTPPFEKDSYRNWTEEKYGRFRRAEGERLLYKMAMRWKWEI